MKIILGSDRAATLGCWFLSAFCLGCTGEPPPTPNDAAVDMLVDMLVDVARDVSDATQIVRPESPLPPLPELTGVRSWIDGDTAFIQFDPVPGATDYRVYALPEAESVVLESDRLVAINDGWFRCAGEHQAPAIGFNRSLAGEVWVDASTHGELAGFMRDESASVVGHAWLHAREGAIPVYALGDPTQENECERERFNETRTKRYTSDPNERASLIAMGWRDDGVAFYRPANDEGTVPLYENDVEFTGTPFRLYYLDDAEREFRGDGRPQLRLFESAQEDTVPVYRAHYSSCGANHDELIAGEERFRRATRRGNLPVLELQWPGLSESTTLVVEALDVGCPFQGHISTRRVEGLGFASNYPSVADVQAAEPHHQVFVNAQHAPEGHPSPTHRSYIEAVPLPIPVEDWDSYFRFDAPFASTIEVTDRNSYGGEDVFLETDDLYINFYSIEPEMWALDSVRGELWVSYSDWASDTNGKLRIMPKATTTLAADSFLRVRMDVDIWSTGRRYPQMWVTDVAPPMQTHLEEGTSLNIQTFESWANDLQIQLCQHRTWDVNNQCPGFRLQPEPFSGDPWPPSPLAQEHSFPGRKARLEAYVSTGSVYLYLDGEPYGCAEFPEGAFDAGEVHVAFGDVLYHSGVDEPVVGSDALPFIRDYQLTETRRYFDNLAFDAGHALPAWPNSLPCQTELSE